MALASVSLTPAAALGAEPGERLKIEQARVWFERVVPGFDDCFVLNHHLAVTVGTIHELGTDHGPRPYDGFAQAAYSGRNVCTGTELPLLEGTVGLDPTQFEIDALGSASVVDVTVPVQSETGGSVQRFTFTLTWEGHGDVTPFVVHNGVPAPCPGCQGSGRGEHHVERYTTADVTGAPVIDLGDREIFTAEDVVLAEIGEITRVISPSP